MLQAPVCVQTPLTKKALARGGRARALVARGSRAHDPGVQRSVSWTATRFKYSSFSVATVTAIPIHRIMLGIKQFKR